MNECDKVIARVLRRRGAEREKTRTETTEVSAKTRMERCSHPVSKTTAGWIQAHRDLEGSVDCTHAHRVLKGGSYPGESQRSLSGTVRTRIPGI